ncbi:jg27238, partial [Pararge aegeria aegeria]
DVARSVGPIKSALLSTPKCIFLYTLLKAESNGIKSCERLSAMRNKTQREREIDLIKSFEDGRRNSSKYDSKSITIAAIACLVWSGERLWPWLVTTRPTKRTILHRSRLGKGVYCNCHMPNKLAFNCSSFSSVSGSVSVLGRPEFRRTYGRYCGSPLELRTAKRTPEA